MRIIRIFFTPHSRTSSLKHTSFCAAFIQQFKIYKSAWIGSGNKSGSTIVFTDTWIWVDQSGAHWISIRVPAETADEEKQKSNATYRQGAHNLSVTREWRVDGMTMDIWYQWIAMLKVVPFHVIELAENDIFLTQCAICKLSVLPNFELTGRTCRFRTYLSLSMELCSKYDGLQWTIITRYSTQCSQRH